MEKSKEEEFPWLKKKERIPFYQEKKKTLGETGTGGVQISNKEVAS